MTPPVHRLPDDAVLIVGAGLAGLFLALNLAPRRAVVLSPRPLGEGASSAWAQGGLAAALAPEDSPELHARDTIEAGAGLVDPAIALMVAEEGPARVRDLLRLGVPFDRSADGALSLALEAAHSLPRVAKVKGDLAGREIMAALIRAARAAEHIEVRENVRARALLTDANGRCAGALTEGPEGRVALAASETALCAGGSGGLFRVTTNPPEARGDGFAMAHAMGAATRDLEFVQFHPTALDVGRDPAPLASEALRGLGAILVNTAGERFMPAYDARAELAPRDVVARAIHAELVAGRRPMLDCRPALGERFAEEFPTVFASAMAAGIDPRRAPLPVAPAAHYHCGGVATDEHGRSSVEGLWAIGETARTGLHGANRLASNSLLEAVVFAWRAAATLKDEPRAASAPIRTTQAPPRLPDAERQRLRAAMSEHAGVVRDAAGLGALLDLVGALEAEHGPATPVVAARAIAEAALARPASVGGHFRSDEAAAMPAAAAAASEAVP